VEYIPNSKRVVDLGEEAKPLIKVTEANGGIFVENDTL